VDEPPPLPPETGTRPPRGERPDQGRSSRHGAVRRWALWLVVLVAVFLAGLVIGRAIEDAPQPGGQQTGVRTLQPSTLAPVETVTITVSGG
jgi:hypothetical protein